MGTWIIRQTNIKSYQNYKNNQDIYKQMESWIHSTKPILPKYYIVILEVIYDFMLQPHTGNNSDKYEQYKSWALLLCITGTCTCNLSLMHWQWSD